MIQRSTQTRQLGPDDHGRPMTYAAYLAGDYQPGYKYELIDGELYVSPEANADHVWVEIWLSNQLLDYSREHPEVINFVTIKSRLFVPNRPGVTVPEPDFAAYHDFPQRRPRGGRRWENLSPILVAEVVSPDSAEKDLVRNVELYWQVPSIKEYWLLDPREVAPHPLTAYRRQARKWKPIPVAYGETYTTRLLPGFELVIETLG
jgi:Uma2 family endonuclease